MIKSNIKTSGFTLAIVVIEGNRLYGVLMLETAESICKEIIY